MNAASFFKRVVNIPRSLCLIVGGVMSVVLYLGRVMTVNQIGGPDWNTKPESLFLER